MSHILGLVTLSIFATQYKKIFIFKQVSGQMPLIEQARRRP